ncbi:MAG: glycosyltransferase family 39 protein [Chloroflexi bacterium]|nr:glycosyltransferase family 39 protein [Chloroflexota bacterium]
MTFLQAPTLVVLLFIAVFLLAVGAALLVWGGRNAAEQTAAAPLDWLEALFAALMTVVTLTGWLAVLLASLGRFSLLTLALLLLVAMGVVWWWRRPFLRPRFLPLTRHEMVLLVLLLGFAILYFRPHEYILGSNDAGTYMNIAATVAQTGDFVLHDEWTSFLRQYADVTLREQPGHLQTRFLQFVGWYIDDADATRLIPQFFLFHPVWLAVGISVGGITGGLLLTPLWSVLGLVAVYLLARRLFDRSTALLTAVLLGITPTHLYFARYPTTEPLTLLLIFTGLLALQHIWDDAQARPAWGVLGGLALGSAVLTRIDLPVFVVVVLAGLLIRWRQGRWTAALTVYTAVLGAFLIHATLSAVLINWPYTWNTYSSMIRIFSRSTLVVGGASLLLVGLAVGGWVWRKGWVTAVDIQKILGATTTRRILALLLILLSAYAYFLRPIVEPVQISYNVWPSGSAIPYTDGQNWLRLGWYLTPLGILLATLGAAWLVAQSSWDRYGLFLSLGVLTTAQYVYRILNTPYHIYAMRRYVPIVIPMLVLYAAVLIIAVTKARPDWRWRAAGGLLAVALAVGLLYQGRYVLPVRDYHGAVAQLEMLHGRLNPDAIILITEPASTVFADTFGVPLRFLYGHDIATIRQDGAAAQLFVQALLAYAAEQKRPLQVIALDPMMTAVRQQLVLQPVAFVPIWLSHLMNTFTDYPSVVQTAYYGLEIYDVVGERETAVTTPTLPLTIDVGSLDTSYIHDDFYYKEPLRGETTMRWTGALSTVDIPLSATPATLTIRAMIYRPEGVPATPVNVLVNGQSIGQFIPGPEWNTYSFTIPPGQGTGALQFQSTPFNPSDLQLSGDGRDLGFLLDWIQIAP